MDTIELGRCPFCGGVVTADVDCGRDDATVEYRCRPVCKNGCPTGDVVGLSGLRVKYDEKAGPERVGADLAAEWEGACGALCHPRPCPICGDRPMFVAVRASLRFGCPTDWLTESSSGTPLVRMVGRWNEWVAEAEQANRLQAELEAQCEVLNRAYWPDRLKGEWD